MIRNIIIDDIIHFLGITIEDVMGFINKKECLLCGHWKVYSNCERAQKIFGLYEEPKQMIMQNILPA